MAVIIVATIASLLMFSYGSMSKKTEATTCLANRKTIIRAFNIYKLGNTEPSSLNLFLKNEGGFADTWLNNTIKCPSKGTYTASGDILICSIHNPAPVVVDPTDPTDPTTPPENMIPGTNEYGGSGILAEGKWEESWRKKGAGWALNVAEGTKFYENGKFYIATQGYDGKGTYPLPYPTLGNGIKPWNGGINGGIVEATGKYTSWDEVSTGDKFKRGDIIYKDGNYYLCKILTVGTETIDKKYPIKTEGGNNWYKMES